MVFGLNDECFTRNFRVELHLEVEFERSEGMSHVQRNLYEVCVRQHPFRVQYDLLSPSHMDGNAQNATFSRSWRERGNSLAHLVAVGKAIGDPVREHEPHECRPPACLMSVVHGNKLITVSIEISCRFTS